jgi:hypothetical protein
MSNRPARGCGGLYRLGSGLATNRTPWCRNTARASDGTTQIAGIPCRCSSSAWEPDSVEAYPPAPWPPQTEAGLIGWAHGEVDVGPGRPQVPCGPGQLEEQGLIDAQWIRRIGPLIPVDAVAQNYAGRQCRHLLDEGRSSDAVPPKAEPTPMEPSVETGLGVAALSSGEGTGGGAVEPAGAGDGDRTGFTIAAGQAEGSVMGLGRGTAEGTQDPDRAAGQGLATTNWRASAQRNTGEPGLIFAAARILGRPAASAGPLEDHRAGAQASGMVHRWLSFRCRLDADAAKPCEPRPEGPAPQGHAPPGHGASDQPHPGLGPENDLLIRGQDQVLGPGHVVRLGADVALAIKEQHPQQLAGGIK